MPIVGLSNRVEIGFPRLGKIRKGDEQREVKGKRVVGQDLEYFRFTGEVTGIEATVLELYGPQPKELRIWLPYATVSANFDPWMKEYGHGGLKRMCDGEQQHVWLPEGKNTYVTVENGAQPIPCLKKVGKKCDCIRDAGLKVILEDVFSKGRCGYFELKTSSKHDILHIGGVLQQAYAMAGKLTGIPFIVRRQSEELSYPYKDKDGNEKRGRRFYNLIKMEIDPAWMQQQIHNQYAIAMGQEPTKAIAPSMPTYAEVERRIETRQIAAAIDHDWRQRIKAARLSAGLEQDDAAGIAADNNVKLADGITIEQVDLVIAAIEATASAAIEYEVTIEGE